MQGFQIKTMNRMTQTVIGMAIGLCMGLASASLASGDQEDASSFEVVPLSKVDWQQLNPARGDKSPQAGTLWGDRKGKEPTGFLAKFLDGFSSPPHIHNATYRAVVIEGLIHNDDPSAEKMWMPAGSFWTQPKGEMHITAAKGDRNMALVEIDMGPYLVLGENEKFDSGERPVNVVPSNLVWTASDGFELSEENPKIAYLWGDLADGQSNGTFIKLPKGFHCDISVDSPTFRAVVIQGRLGHAKLEHAKLGNAKPSEGKLLPGSYFGSTGSFVHKVSAESDTILYVRTQGRYQLSKSSPAQ